MPTEDYIITRKRKKYKFARFAESPNCFEAEEWRGAAPDAADVPVVIELGAGTGLFSVELARRHPRQAFVAVDVKADRLYQGAIHALHDSIGNVYFLRAHARQLSELFAPGSVRELWLTFPDPYPKKRHAKHRMTHPAFFEIYKTLLQPEGLFRFKTDNRILFEWSLMSLAEQKARLAFISFDVHHTEKVPEPYAVMTTYEARYAGEGASICALDASDFK